MLQQFHREEEERQKKSKLQVMEGFALVDQAKLLQQMKDQLILDRKRSVKTNNLEKALKLHNDTNTTAMENEFVLDGTNLNQINLEGNRSSNSISSNSNSNGNGSSEEEEEEEEEENVRKVGQKSTNKRERVLKEKVDVASEKNFEQKSGRVAQYQTVVENSREYTVKDDSPDSEEEIVGKMDNYLAEDEEVSSMSEAVGGDNDSSDGDDDIEKLQDKKNVMNNSLNNKEDSEAKTWCLRVQEFQCSKQELLKLRNIDLKSRVRDLEVLLSQLSEKVMIGLTLHNELLSSTEILDITIGQLMERISPGHINIKTGNHGKGRSFPKPNTNRKHFDKF
jgi:hypothetical protein